VSDTPTGASETRVRPVDVLRASVDQLEMEVAALATLVGRLLSLIAAMLLAMAIGGWLAWRRG